MNTQTNNVKRCALEQPAKQATEPRATQEMLPANRASSNARVGSLSCPGGRFDIRAEREYHCCSEFEQLLLTCIEGVVYTIISSKFMLLYVYCTKG